MDIFEVDTLRRIVERGPILEGNVSSDRAYARLLNRGMVMTTVINGVPGYVVATESGIDEYLIQCPYTQVAVHINRHREQRGKLDVTENT